MQVLDDCHMLSWLICRVIADLVEIHTAYIGRSSLKSFKASWKWSLLTLPDVSTLEPLWRRHQDNRRQHLQKRSPIGFYLHVLGNFPRSQSCMESPLANRKRGSPWVLALAQARLMDCSQTRVQNVHNLQYIASVASTTFKYNIALTGKIHCLS